MKKKILITTIIAFLLAVTVLIIIFIKDISYFESGKYLRDNTKPAKVLVVFYSRSGNTEAMAKTIAKHFNADLKYIDAAAYPRSFNGWRNAASDARNLTETDISYEKIDFNKYNLVFLGSPIWLFRPAPPLWRFVAENNFKTKKVILFNTFNSRFKQENIDKFSNLLKTKNGKLIDHIYIRRGRVIPNQKDGNDVITETKSILINKEKNWF